MKKKWLEDFRKHTALDYPTKEDIKASKRRPHKELRIEQLNLKLKRYAETFKEHRANPRLYNTSYQEFLGSDNWKATRIIKLLSVDFICEGCGCDLVPPKAKAIHPLWSKDTADIHHLSYRRVGYEALCDLQALCRACHHSIHQYR